MTKTIAIVEDDQLLGQMYQLKLAAHKFESILTPTARQLSKLLATSTVDLIILDIMLPKVNGLQILKELRKHKDHAKIPVIILTNLNQIDVELSDDLAEVLGVKAYLVKSKTSLDDIIKTVKTSLAR